MYVPSLNHLYVYAFAGFLACFQIQRSIVSTSVPIQGSVQPNGLPGTHTLQARAAGQLPTLVTIAGSHGPCRSMGPSKLGCPTLLPASSCTAALPHHCRLSPPDLSVGGPLAAAPCCAASLSAAFCFLSATCLSQTGGETRIGQGSEQAHRHTYAVLGTTLQRAARMRADQLMQ